jgi:pyruvate formate lyase activating enzyme
MACKFCQNWDMSKSRRQRTLAEEAAPGTIAHAARACGCRSVAYTYNEPTVFFEYAVDVARACRELGIRSVAVTAGYISPEPRAEFYRWMDAANVDLKAFSERFYRSLCGAELGPVLDTLVYIARETKVWLEITTLLIPGENDSSEELERMSLWIADKLGVDVPLHFSAFHPDWKMLDKPRTPLETLIRAREIARKNGLRHVYTGNVSHRAGDTTYCHGCGAELIRRDCYEIEGWNLGAKGECSRCGTVCAGVFEGPPGDWGSRRQPIHPKDFEA